jgi:hypothetical protein
MAEIKRAFYNKGDAKGFTKAIFFQTVEAMANGEDVDPGLVTLVGAAAAYELEGISLKSDSKATGEKKDPLDSDYAKALAAAIVPLVPATGDGLTAKELIELATSKNLLSPKGTPFAAPWVSRVLNATAGVTATKKIVETKDAKGLKAQKEVTAYIAG